MKAADFAGRTVYVVGGSMGIGLAVAKRVARLGSHVAIFARRVQPLEQAAEEVAACCTKAGQGVTHHQLDVTIADEVDRVMQVAVATVGAPDVLINCAGKATPNYFERISHAQLADTLAVNLCGTWNTISALLPHMKKRGGYIVNTSSLAGLIGVFGYTDYCAAKFAVVGLSEALRSELKRDNIVVSVLCPPDTDTPGLQAEEATKPAETRAVAGSARVLSADAVAAALLAGMARRSRLIIPGVEGKLAVLVKRLLPGVVEAVTDHQVRRAAARSRT